MPEQPPIVRSWHAVVESRDPASLDGLLADDVEFRSPAVFSPQRGRAAATHYLTAAIAVLGPSLRYTEEWYAESSAVLEFEASLDGLYVQGVDMLRWNDAGQLVSFTVLVRPLRGLEKLIELMARQLTTGQALRLHTGKRIAGLDPAQQPSRQRGYAGQREGHPTASIGAVAGSHDASYAGIAGYLPRP
jgi:hypothetical protein